jgi:type I restriction enzyme S subunit
MLEPKEGWTSMKLGDFAYMKAGDFVKASDIYQDYTEGLYPCYGGNGLRGYVKEPNQEGDFCLIGRQGALCGCVNRAKGIFRTTEHAVIVKPYQEIPTSLVYYLLNHLNLNKYATGAAQPGLSVKNIAEQVIITVPPISEQQTIVDTLDSLKSKIDRLQANYDKISQECDALKQAILRQVFE